MGSAAQEGVKKAQNGEGEFQLYGREGGIGKGIWGAVKKRIDDIFMVFHFCHGLVLSLINGSLLDFWGYKASVLILLSLKRRERDRSCSHTLGFYF